MTSPRSNTTTRAGQTCWSGKRGNGEGIAITLQTYEHLMPTIQHDADTRLSSLSLSNVSSGTILFRSQRGYDAASNVTAVNTTLAAGSDNQVFWYDDENRLVWAGAAGTSSCGATLTPGTLTSASYTQTFAYDALDRLTSGPLGSYTYGNSAHLHAATAIGTNVYTASYDASGNMTCRAPDNTTTCAGTPTGAQLAYDNEGRLSGWQNTPSSPTTSDSFLYDGAGNRVEQSVTINGSITTTTTYVAGGLEEIASNGTSTTLTKYFSGASGLPTAERVGTNGPLSYLATDGQGTVSESLDSAGNVTSGQLYTPYGVARYSSGSSPTSIGYTGQRADSTTGLDYYHARYYDPTAGQFISADTANDGTNRYGYVHGNPTTYTDPSGHRCFSGDGGVCGSPGSAPPPPPSCTSDANCGCYANCGGSSGSGSSGGSGGSGGSGKCGGSGTCSLSNPTALNGGQRPCSKDPICMKRYNKWKYIIGLDAGAGWTNLIGDVYTLATEGSPMITELLALFGGDVAVLGSLVMHLADVIFALTDIVRTVTQLLGAQPDGQLQGTIRGFEAVAGVLKLLVDMGGAFFAFVNPLQAVEDWFSKAAKPFIMKGFLSMLGFLATHIGVSWLPQILSVSAEDFLSLTPDQAMEKYQWMRTIDLPTPFAGA